MNDQAFNLNQWIGLPFYTRGRGPEKFDCYGLVRAVLQDARGITLPAFLDDEEPLDPDAHGHLARWVLVDASEPLPFDILHFQLPHHASTIGLAVNTQNGLDATTQDFLHVSMGEWSHLERLQLFYWRSKLRGIYRYEV